MMLARNWFAKSTLLLFCLLGLSLNDYAKAEVSNVSLQLRWHHQFQFAGYYMAIEKGFYKQAGLTVNLIEGNYNINAIDEVLNGKATFGVGNSRMMYEFLQGAPIVNLASIFQKSPSTWIVHENSDIYTASDFSGKKVQTIEESADLKAMFLYEGISLDSIDFVPYGKGLDEFIAGNSDAIAGYMTNEPYQLDLQGINYRLIQPMKYGIDFYGDTLMTSQAFVRENPETVNAFTEASLKGWEYAFTHVNETINVIKSRYASEKTIEHLQYEADEMRKLVLPDLISLGHINPRRWLFITQTYEALGLVHGFYDLDNFIYIKDKPVDYSRFLKWALFLSIFTIIGWIAVVWYMSVNKRLNAQIKKRKAVEVEREKLIDSLQSALEEIKTLKGILPVCSYCYKIRDDEGSWDKLESYISRNTEAIVTHGVCPNCIDKLANN